MKREPWKKALSLLLALALVLSLAPVAAAAEDPGRTVTFEEISPDQVTAGLLLESAGVEEQATQEPDPDETVRVSIVLEKQSVLERGYETMNIAFNDAAMRYRKTLEADQQAVQARISTAIGSQLDVAWNLTLAANIISADVRYGDIETIKATRGVADVVLETKYEPCETEEGTAQPNSGTATVMTGASTVWASGYTGAGSRIAIIDTGLDTDHEAVDNGAYLYAMANNAKAAGMTAQEYMASLNLLDEEEIAAVLPQLNIYKGYNDVEDVFKKDDTLTADVLHLTDKVPFAYNYIDRDMDVTHDNDYQGGHGSHVAGIAAANRYVPEGENYVPSMESTFMVGAAPDAQLIIMKVFGKAGGAYDADYIAAIEDAILLDCDVVNLSLGSSYPGFTVSQYYQEVLDKLTETDTVVSISAGNNGAWPEYTQNGALYADDVNFLTGGSPGTYDNAFTVASVNNAGMTGSGFSVGQRDVVYSENLYYQAALSTLDTSENGTGTDFSYVFLDGLGYPDEYEGIDVKGKVVFVSRGVITFAEKLTNAANAGAAACIIYNNVEGAPINMDLTGCYVRIPCVGITRMDAGAIRAAGTAVKDGEGNVLYSTGTMTIGHKQGTTISLSEDNIYTMSSFSSWGVTGGLTLKPEITAPGGNIYSINGQVPQTNQYFLMSGTSMASPHNAGLVALLCQYFRETGLPEKLGVSPRVLAQSLLMSTATPIVDANSGLPYPVIQQGAGLGNASDAMNAASYVMVENQPDGKVKAELGDDPDRTGVYTFNYTLHNLGAETQQYTLDTDVFTQAYGQFYLEQYGEEDWYTDYTLTKLSAVTTYCVNGKEVLPEAGQLAGLDFNGDGKVNEADGQALLDYAVGKVDTLTNLNKADLSGDGKLTAYDAELFLSRLGKHTVTLPANGEITVTVTITLPDTVKEELDKVFTNGAYIEAYTYATPFATGEGVLASAHSIPVLAFYGGWDEPNMFDRVTHTEVADGTSEKVPYLFDAYNYVAASYMDDGAGYVHYLGGNSFAQDDQYLPERNAIRSNAGDAVTAMNFCLIRAAGGFRSAITNVDTSEVYAYEEFDHVYPAYYISNYMTWRGYSQSVVPGTTGDEGWAVTDKEGNPLPEGTTVELMVQAAPEYYLREDNTVDWNKINPDGSTLSLRVTVDNTAPELKSVSVGTETDLLTGESYDFVEAVAQDNRYTAAVILMTPGGTKIITRKSANQTVEGAESRVRLDITGVYGRTFMLGVVDYAGNATYYNVTVSTPFAGPTATLYGASNAHEDADWHRFTSDTNYDYETLKETKTSIGGAAYGGGYLFYTSTASGSRDSQYYLYVLDYPSFAEPIQIGPVSGSPFYKAPINYLAYNTDDGYLYYTRMNRDTGKLTLYRLDVADASETPVAAFNGEYQICGLAYSAEENCFYTVAFKFNYDPELGKLQNPTGLFRFTLPENGEDITLEQAADLGIWDSMADQLVLDETQNAAYLTVSRNTYIDILTYEFDTKTMTATGRLDNHFGIFLPDDNTADDNSITREQPTSIKLNREAMNLFAGGQKQLSAEVGPWCLKDKSVVWTSSDPTVATVDENGMVKGLKEGTATITAASILDGSVKAECAITVIGNSFSLRIVGNDDKGGSSLFTYDLKAGKASGQIAVIDESGKALPVESAAVDSQNHLWVQDNVVDEKGKGYRMYTIDSATGKATYTSEVNTNIPGSDSLLFSDIAVDDFQNTMMAVNGEGILYFSEDLSANNAGSAYYDSFNGETLVGITTGATWMNYSTKYTRFYLLCASGKVITCDLSWNDFFGSWGILMNYYNPDKELTFVTDENSRYQDSLIYNEGTNALLLSHYTGENSTELYALDLTKGEGYSDGTCNVVYMGEVEGFDSVALYDADYVGLSVPQSAQAPEVQSQGEQILLTTAEETIPMGTANVAAEALAKAEGGIVTVTIRAEEAAASGMLEIALDENATLISLESPATLSAYTEKDGKIVFGYADYEAIAKGEVIATLRLKLNARESAVTLTETERGGKALEEKTTLTLRNVCDGKTDCPSAAFSDLDTGKWYHEYTDYVLENGLMKGMGDGIFAPEGAVTRGMMVTMLYRMAGEPEVKNAAPFTDVAQGRYYAKAVAWAYENGIVKGMTDTTFAPNAPATREQLVTLLYRYAGFAGLDVSARGDALAFGDGGTVSAFARESVSWAIGEGLLKGDENGMLLPRASATRAQLAAILCRFLENG